MNELFIPAELHPRHPEKTQPARRPFTGGPRPEALIIACSDCTLDGPLSRYFENRPVFLLRTFGNEVPEFFHAQDELINALEEAVCWWRVPRIIVCGHSGCSAMREPPEKQPDSTEASPAPAFQAMLQRMGEASQKLEKAKRHTREQLETLRSYPFINNRLHEEELEVSAMFYLHMSGLFLRYDEAQGEYRPVL